MFQENLILMRDWKASWNLGEFPFKEDPTDPHKHKCRPNSHTLLSIGFPCLSISKPRKCVTHSFMMSTVEHRDKTERIFH